jgi:DNA-binding ferritin-like protein
MDEKAHHLLSVYVAFTRALYSLHQQNHWASVNYGDHLLFQRLYEESLELVDDAAERTIGLCGSLLLEGSEASIVKKYAPKEKSLVELIKSSLAIEEAFQVICKKVYNIIKEKEMMTLGLDDLIMSQADIGETHIYLLRQSLKGHQ